MALPSFVQPNIEEWLKSFKFYTTIRPRFNETDAFGHINNVNFFTYFEQARLDFFEELTLVNSLVDSLNESIIVTANLECHYLSQLFYGQKIQVHVRASKIGRSSFELEYAIIEQVQQAVVAIGRGTIVYINKKTNRSEELPSFIKDIFQQFNVK